MGSRDCAGVSKEQPALAGANWYDGVNFANLRVPVCLAAGSLAASCQ